MQCQETAVASHSERGDALQGDGIHYDGGESLTHVSLPTRKASSHIAPWPYVEAEQEHTLAAWPCEARG